MLTAAEESSLLMIFDVIDVFDDMTHKSIGATRKIELLCKSNHSTGWCSILKKDEKLYLIKAIKDLV